MATTTLRQPDKVEKNSWRGKLIRWGVVGGPQLRRYARQELQGYDSLTDRLRRLQFGLSRRVLALRNRGAATREHAHVARDLGRAISGAFVLAVVLVFLARIIETAAISGITPIFGAGSPLVGFLKSVPSRAEFQSLLDTVVQVTALFLGLYYTAVSVIVSTSYKDVPGGVRRRILTEQAGNFYINLVAFTGAVALLMDGLLVGGWNPGWLNLGILVLCSVGSALAFVVLGVRLFNFFDPATIAQACVKDIVTHARSATSQGYRSGDPSFQHWYRKRAEDDLTILHGIVVLAASVRGRARESLKTALDHIVVLLTIYARLVPHIPTSSLWFGQRAQHPSWFSSGYTELSTAIRTNTGLPWKRVPDHFWLEQKLLESVSSGLNELLANREYDLVVSLTNTILHNIEGFASRYQFEHAIRLTRLLTVFAREERMRVGDPDAGPNRAIAIEALATGPIHLVLGLSQALQSFSPAAIKELALRTAREPVGAPIDYPVPTQVRKEIDRVRAAWDFERSAEGSGITPAWFWAHRVGRSYAEAVQDVLPQIATEIEYLFHDISTDPTPDNRDAVVISIQRGLETTHKLDYHLSAVEQGLGSLSTLATPVDTHDEWPDLALDALRQRTNSLTDELLFCLADVGTRLGTQVPSGDSPDTLGFAYTALTDACFRAMLQGKWELVERIYPRTLRIQIMAYERVREERKQYNAEYGIAALANVAADILELGGIALIAAEATDAPPKLVVKIWDEFLDSLGRSPAVQVLISMWDVHEQVSMSVLHPRAVQRSAWKQEMRRWLEGNGLIDRGSRSRRNYQVDNSRPLLSTYIRSGELRRSAGELFIADYLSARPEAEGVELSESVKDAQRGLRRIREQRQRRKDPDSRHDHGEQVEDE